MKRHKFIYWCHNITKKLYPYDEWINIGDGIGRDGKKDLPKDGYPYRVYSSKETIPKEYTEI